MEKGDDNNFEPPCPLAKQCIGGGFAFFFSLSTSLLFHSPLLTTFALSTGAAFGTLGAEKALPYEINFKEFLVLFCCSLICCLILNNIFSTDNILGLIIESFLCSSFASAIHMVLIFSGKFILDPKLTRVCHV